MVTKQKKPEHPSRQRPKQPSEQGSGGTAKYVMRLFVAGSEQNSLIARKNIKEICSKYLKNGHEIDIIDVFEDHDTAIAENILVTPALVVDRPKKVKIFGNLEDRKKVLFALGVK